MSKAYVPCIGLQRAHRPAQYQLQFLDAELLGEKALLSDHVVSNVDWRECASLGGRWRVAGRGRGREAEVSGQDDEILARIERATFADPCLESFGCAAQEIWEENGIVFCGIQAAVCLVCQLSVRQGDSRCQLEVAQSEDFHGVYASCNRGRGTTSGSPLLSSVPLQNLLPRNWESYR